MKETRHKRKSIVCFYRYEISRIGKSIKTERLEITGLGELGNGGFLNYHRVSVWGDNILEIDSGDGCTIL